MNSKKYLEDFLADEEFIRWVKSSDPELEEFWSRWMIYHPEMRELVLLAKEIVLSFGEEDRDYKNDELEEAKEAILKHILTHSDGKASGETPVADHRFTNYRNRGISFYNLIRIAAVLIFCVGLSLIAYHFNAPSGGENLAQQLVVKENPYGRRQTYLPDGTMVWLNSGTKITYASDWNNLDTREVVLEGEAYFKVKKDSLRPFIVTSKNFITTALGTFFNVNAYPDDESVVISLEEGKVLVEQAGKKDSDSYILTPGIQLAYSATDKKVNIQAFDTEIELGWINGVLLFKNASFDEVIERLQKFYTISVELKGVKPRWNYTGRFTNASLEQVLERLSSVEQFNYTLKDKNLTIWRK